MLDVEWRARAEDSFNTERSRLSLSTFVFSRCPALSRGYCLFNHLVDQLLQLFSRLEIRDFFRWDFNLLASFRIAARARLAAAQTEAAEAAKLDFLTGAQRVDDRIEDDVHDRL